MPVYVFQWDYKSSYGQGKKGDKADFDQQEAEIINRDSPGVLVLETLRRLPSPPNDRQVKSTKTRRSGVL